MVFANVPRAIGLLLIILTFAGQSAAAPEITKENGERLQRKLDAITRNAANVPVPPAKTSASEAEVNSYLAYNLKEKMPTALSDPEIKILGDGRVAGRVFLDMDEFNRRRQARSSIDPLSFVTGKVPVTASGTLRTQNGQAQFTLISAEIQGIPLPKPILQQMVAFLSRTRNNPDGFDMEQPFKLPAKIREVSLRPAQVTVVQ